MNLSTRCRTIIILSLAAVVLISLGSASCAFAQQRELTLPPTVPRNQRQGGSVLEVPIIPSRQGGGTETIPRISPQQNQELTLPSRQLARQPGYNQLTVTILD